MGGGGQDRCKRRSEVFVKLRSKTIIFFGGGEILGGGVGSGRVGGVKGFRFRGGGVRVEDVNEEIEVFVKIKKWGGRGEGSGGGGLGGGGSG